MQLFRQVWPGLGCPVSEVRRERNCNCIHSACIAVQISVILALCSSTSMDAVPVDVWAQVLDTLSNSALCSLSACSRACRRVSSYRRTLKVELDVNLQLHSRLVSLLYFLTSRRKHLQVCWLRLAAEWGLCRFFCCFACDNLTRGHVALRQVLLLQTYSVACRLLAWRFTSDALSREGCSGSRGMPWSSLHALW